MLWCFMKILLVADNEDVKELLTFQITTRFKASARECGSAREAAQLLKEQPEAFDLVVGPYHGPDSVLVRSLRELKAPMPVVFFYDPLVVKPDAAALSGLSVLGAVQQTQLVDGVLKAIEGLAVTGLDPVAGLEEFCPIRTNLLIRVSPLKSDIYIRLSETKFVKLFRVGAEFDHDDLERYYQEKQVEYMYLRRLETGEFIEKFRRDLEELLARKDLKLDEHIATAASAQETVHELVRRLGFSAEVLELAKANVALALKLIGSNPRLSEIIGKVANDGNYLSHHAVLLAHVACCVAKEMEWGSEATFHKLVLAAYMHDISLKNPELAKINTIRELQEQKSQFTADEVKEYHLHPARSADIVRSFKDIPADVDVIVQQHHERPNGSGFPRGLMHNYIAPLSAVFILSHDLAQEVLQKGASFSLQIFVKDRKPFFNQGNFKKVITALEKMKA
jgi:CheY-like chemotaxis protein